MSRNKSSQNPNRSSHLSWMRDKGCYVYLPDHMKACFKQWYLFELHGDSSSSWKWLHLLLSASVHRGIELVSTACARIGTKLPLSNFIQPQLVTAEECCMLQAEADTSTLPCNSPRTLRRNLKQACLWDGCTLCHWLGDQLVLWRNECQLSRR